MLEDSFMTLSGHPCALGFLIISSMIIEEWEIRPDEKRRSQNYLVVGRKKWKRSK
jgi:hypothetical protein